MGVRCGEDGRRRGDEEGLGGRWSGDDGRALGPANEDTAKLMRSVGCDAFEGRPRWNLLRPETGRDWGCSLGLCGVGGVLTTRTMVSLLDVVRFGFRLRAAYEPKGSGAVTEPLRTDTRRGCTTGCDMSADRDLRRP